MPTSPNAASPFLPERLQAEFGPRQPGTPSTAGQPGAQAANITFPNPPAPASAPPGRPPNGGTPAPTATGAQPVTGQPASPPVALPPEQPLAKAGDTAKAMGVPDQSLMAAEQARKQAYQEAVVSKREELGAVPSVFNHPSLPQLPIELGKPNFNPFTAKWG